MTCLSVLAHCWMDSKEEKLGKKKGSRLEYSFVEDTFRYNHCYMYVFNTTVYIVDRLKTTFETSGLSRCL